ncbi:hypothetical protein ABFS82_03G010700 [Erythranthe guttata]|uniref:Uncharacterized protein n=1 Tax=Erythranthe guttata TaxID=4155 RepID=A0A022Q9Q2_ERYGU|nr:PREDICTED: uncharacterized protein LOC105972601 [Erythranthe guttata]EYU24334.1 hypothetical protein MIMGU_mgv1a015399mg [Erythranthe guttata]|eukprot:XP_012853018.1 PREDICTED: uncharacterized protein LOC105972601 [Erythranthe guttata]
MLHRSSLHLHKLLSRHAFGKSPRTKSQFPTTSAANFSNQISPYHSLNKPHCFYTPAAVSRFNSPFFQGFRNFSAETDKEVDTINLKFAEAREEIESAMDSKETVYFNEEAECAREAVGEVLELYKVLLEKLPEKEKAAIQRAMGLKIEQLKAELEQLNE